ncbi:hypothetical protein AGDE_15261 [Angomonas deanei]|uniref:RNA recognition motif. (A.k.a. RRM, RBD, or RNP domain), putative n=1 Tax=Angomonas deanei TaxID=59799 RepID=A0A7G2CS87_9TRYP|nr:hypothetical protein AGDE_15261 [Angomonas deanei]CAD2222229.1 RNA recognition motif. (a.k.a. RRM, RBD, or RNP domain), putative [Angomonas deanei]|eukprot:EPY19390.1 hypothetical protein AGDE_15261 [Angomonas deanei]
MMSIPVPCSNTNLFIRNLPSDIDDTQVQQIFGAYGVITSSMVMRDIHSGCSLGTAFVRYSCHEEALLALHMASQICIANNTLSVQWAQRTHDSIPSSDDRRKMNKLFLRNVPMSAGEASLINVLKECGTVTRVSIHKDTSPETSPSLQRRIAFITFAEEGAAERGLHLVHNTCPLLSCAGVPLMGKLIRDSFKPSKKRHHKKLSQGISPPTSPEERRCVIVFQKPNSPYVIHTPAITPAPSAIFEVSENASMVGSLNSPKETRFFTHNPYEIL